MLTENNSSDNTLWFDVLDLLLSNQRLEENEMKKIGYQFL